MNQYNPILIKNDKLDPIFKQLSDNKSPYYDPKYSDMYYEDIKLDFQYFNNTSALLWQLQQTIPIVSTVSPP